MKLHKKQVLLLEILKDNEDNPLSIRDIQDELGFSSTSHVHHHIVQLERKGYLKRNPSNSRDYKVLMAGEDPISFINFYSMAKCGPDGTVLSGNPISRIPMASSLIPFEATEAFMVEASGDSMEPKIHSGDIVIAKICDQADDGEIVVCSLNGQVHVKRYRVLGGQRLLESLNQKHFPIVVSPGDELSIEGIYRGLICTHS